MMISEVHLMIRFETLSFVEAGEQENTDRTMFQMFETCSNVDEVYESCFVSKQSFSRTGVDELIH